MVHPLLAPLIGDTENSLPEKVLDAEHPAEITTAANSVLHMSRPIPSKGLTVQQICNVISHIGLDPEVRELDPDIPVVSLIYGYLRIGIPVLAVLNIPGVGYHAVALAGYSLRRKKVLQQEAAVAGIPMLGLRIDEFYAHDDQVGPFARVQVRECRSTSGQAIYFEGPWTDENGKLLMMQPEALIVPVYNKIRVTFIDVTKWLERLHSVIESILPGLSLEWDVYLKFSNDYKTSLRRRASSGNMKTEELLLHHPRFIWRAILRLNNLELCELLFDATDMARSLPVYLAIWHDSLFKGLMKTIVNIR